MLDCYSSIWLPPPFHKYKINFNGAVGSKAYARDAIATDHNYGFQGYQTRELDFITPQKLNPTVRWLELILLSKTGS